MMTPPELDRPGLPPEPGRSFQEPRLPDPYRALVRQGRTQMLAVAFTCLTVGVVGIIALFAGWLS